MSSSQVALQLYTVRDETQKDFAATLQRVATIGYNGVEFAGYGDLSASAIKALLTETGLQAVSTHVALPDLTGEKLDASLAFCHSIGCSTLVLPSLAPEWRGLENLQVLAHHLNEIGQHCLDADITFGYHNHDFEFANRNGGTWLDHLLETTDPALVKIELDVYWAAYSGYDPLLVLQKLGERVALIHVKDMTENHTMIEVGQGTLNMQGIVGFAQQQGIWSVVEHDAPTLPSLQSARISLEYFLQTKERDNNK